MYLEKPGLASLVDKSGGQNVEVCNISPQRPIILGSNDDMDINSFYKTRYHSQTLTSNADNIPGQTLQNIVVKHCIQTTRRKVPVKPGSVHKVGPQYQYGFRSGGQ